MSNVPMTLPGLAISEQKHVHSHTTTFVELDDGRIFLASHKVCQISEDRGVTWTDPQQMKDVDGNDVGDSETSLVKLAGKNSIGLTARVSGDPPPTTYAMPPCVYGFYFWRSDDNGQTWQPPVRMTAPGANTAGLQDTFLRSSSGRILLPVFLSLGQSNVKDDGLRPLPGKLVHNQWHVTGAHDFDGRYSGVYVLYSDDDGATWKRNSDGEILIMLDWNAIYSYGNESSMTEVAPGRLLLFMRNQLGRLFQTWSNDNGETWTRPQPTVLAASTAPCQLRTLPNGHLLCVWNQETEEEIRKGYARSRLSSAISRDGGRVWEFFQNIDSIHETTRVEPGHIRPTRPEELYFPAGQAAVERDPRHVHFADRHSRLYYPSVMVLDDRVIIAYSSVGSIEEHPTKAELVRTGSERTFKVLPLKWFYGGKEPADNPFLREAYEPAKP